MSSFHAPSSAASDALAPAAEAEQRAYFFVSGEASADLMPRILNPFLKLGLAPYRVHATSEHGTGEEMSIELRFASLAPQLVEGLAARCRAVIGVRSVLTVIEG